MALCQDAVKQARQDQIRVVILDTAGRLHIDEELMDQLTRIDRACSRTRSTWWSTA